MKTAEEILNSKGYVIALKHNPELIEAMEEYADQFKSPSPVSQQLTKKELNKLCDEYCTTPPKGRRTTFKSGFIAGQKYSVSPDAQKEISEMRIRFAEECANRIKSEVRDFNRICGEKDKEIAELKAENEKLKKWNDGDTVLVNLQKDEIESLKQQLTSKEADVKRAVEVLGGIIDNFTFMGEVPKDLIKWLNEGQKLITLKGNK